MSALDTLYKIIKTDGALEQKTSKFGGIWSQDMWTLDDFVACLQDDGYTILVRDQRVTWTVRQTGDFPIVYTGITEQEFDDLVMRFQLGL